MSNEVRIGKAGAGDWPAVRDLLTAADLPVADLGPDAMSQFVLARVGGDVVAAIALQPAGVNGLLRSLVVDAARRGEGIGVQLANAVEQRAQRQGLQELWLLTNDTGRFFRQLGYERVSREKAPGDITASHQFRDLCPETAELYRKRLGGSQD